MLIANHKNRLARSEEAVEKVRECENITFDVEHSEEELELSDIDYSDKEDSEEEEDDD